MADFQKWRSAFCVIGNSLEFPITQKGINVPRHILFIYKASKIPMPKNLFSTKK